MSGCFRLSDCVISFLLIIIAYAITDTYLLMLNWYYACFVIGDIVVLILWIIFANLATRKLEHPKDYEREVIQTDLWTAMVQWGSFTMLLLAKIGVLFFLTDLNHFLGSNGISLTLYICVPLMYIGLLGMHHNIKPFARKGVSLRMDIDGVTIDLIDILDIMTTLWSIETLSENSKLPQWMIFFLFCYSSISLIVLPILAIHDARFGTPLGDTNSIPYSPMYNWISFFFVDIANITIRLVNWLLFGHLATISIVFIGKNSVGIFQEIRYFIIFYSSLGPKPCEKCKIRFAADDYAEHIQWCKKANDRLGGVMEYWQGISSKRDSVCQVSPTVSKFKHKMKRQLADKENGDEEMHAYDNELAITDMESVEGDKEPKDSDVAENNIP